MYYRRSLAATILFAFLAPAALGLGRLQDYADRGGQLALRNLAGETIYVQRSCPGATATVYDGTSGSTLATLYSDSTLTAKSNPFTVNTNGFFDFFTNSSTVRVTLSGCSMTWTRTYLVGTSQSSIIYNVVDYGADPLGLADSTTAFTNTITAAGTKPIYVPAGTFLVDGGSPLVRSRFTLTGGMTCAGQSLTEIKVVNSSTFNNTDNNYLFTLSTGSVVEGCTINGNKANNADKRLSGININGSTSNVTIRDMTFEDFPTYDVGFDVYAGDGINISTTGSNIRVLDSNFTGNERTGVLIAAGTGVTVDNSLFDGNGVFGMDVELHNDADVINRVIISNSRFINAASAQVASYGGGLYIVGRTTGLNYIRNVTLVNNIITNNRAYGRRTEGVQGLHETNTTSFNNSRQGAGLWPNCYFGDHAKTVMFTSSACAASGTDSPSYSIDVANTGNVTDLTFSNVYWSTLNDPGEKIGGRFGSSVLRKIPTGTATWDPASMSAVGTAGSSTSTDVTVSGLVAGDLCIAGLTTVNTTTSISCYAISSNTARVTLMNPQNSVVDFGSGTVRVFAFRP